MPGRTPQPVTVTLAGLRDGSADALLPQAFGPDSLGILLVSGLGAAYAGLRARGLAQAGALAALGRGELAALEVPAASWAVGWSRGRETLASGRPDTLKGSFYVNCNFVRRPGLDGADPETVARFPGRPENTAPNVWPDPARVPGFEDDVKALIAFLVGVTRAVAAACDRALREQLPGLPQSLEHIVAESDTTKARLLHYFRSAEPDEQWCGDHVDHSCLTALTSALWGPGADAEPADGPGLYIRSRAGDSVKVLIPKDCIAIQTGSALEAITRGAFKAVPHRVVGDDAHWRSTLAVFCQPRMEEPVGDVTFADYSARILQASSGKG